jgi:hypothetical protein
MEGLNRQARLAEQTLEPWRQRGGFREANARKPIAPLLHGWARWLEAKWQLIYLIESFPSESE